MNQLPELFHSENDDDILDVDIQMLQALLVVSPSLEFIQSQLRVLNKDEGANIGLKNYISMFAPIKESVKLTNGNMGHA